MLSLEAGRAAARVVAPLRERTGLSPAHAVQLLELSGGSLDAALALFEQDPGMFNVPQHQLLQDGGTSHSAARSSAPAASVPAFASAVVAAPTDGTRLNFALRTAPSYDVDELASPAAVQPGGSAQHAAHTTARATQAAPVLPAPAPAPAPAAPLPKHSRSPTALAKRKQKHKQKRAEAALLAVAPADGAAGTCEPGAQQGSGSRHARELAAAFARGAAAERAAAKERRGARRVGKRQHKAQHKAAQRMGRRRRVEILHG